MLRVTAYTGGWQVPSARFRVRQYIPSLQQKGIVIDEKPARFGCYPPARRSLRAGWGALAVVERLHAALGSRGDLTLLQREMISSFATVERFTKHPRILDVDDAIWLMRGGRCAMSLARASDTVICGNAYIADFFSSFAPKVVVLPTPVDTNRYRPSPMRASQLICWSGSSSGLRYLYGIESALAAVLCGNPGRRLRIVCDAPPRFHLIPAEQIEFVRWSEDIEVPMLQDAGAAIMPLDNSAWSLGKCSYKLLTYMACGVPVVATPIGMNREVLSLGEAGFAAGVTDDWIDALNTILGSPSRAAAMGDAGRRIVERDYSLAALAPRMASILQTVAGFN